MYRATGDSEWLRTSGAYDVVEGVAQFIKSRVAASTTTTELVSSETQTQTFYHLRGVMPIDEWCDEDSGCAQPGVDDDPQVCRRVRVCVRGVRVCVDVACVCIHVSVRQCVRGLGRRV